MVQVTYNPSTLSLHKEFFGGHSNREVHEKMDRRLEELEAKGHQPVLRAKIGRNTTCPCGSGLKFKKCCIRKMR